jgi:hypothetical protein
MFDGEKTRFGLASRSPGSPIVWQDTWLTLDGLVNERFSSDVGFGNVGYDQLLLFTDVSATIPQSLTPGSQLAHGYGPQIIWGYSSASIRSYTVATGSVDLISFTQPRVPMGARMSETRIVWVDATRPGELFADARWHWSPRATDSSGIVTHDGPSVPVVGSLFDMHTAGDWAAASGQFGMDQNAETRTFVWNMATGETWILPNRKGKVFARLFAVTATELVLGERLVYDPFRPVLDSIVRIDLAALPSLVQQWSN